jgi:hypothetical protein
VEGRASYVCMRRKTSTRVIIENNNNDYLAPGCRTEHRSSTRKGVSVDALMIPFAPPFHVPHVEATLRNMENENSLSTLLALYSLTIFRIKCLAALSRTNKKQNNSDKS